MRKTVKLTMIGLSAFYLSGCVSWFYTPGMGELRELCEKDGGVQVYETVEAEGYFDGSQHGCWGCWNVIIREGFQYFELEIKGSDGLDIFNHDQGYWRLEKVERDSGQCHAGIEKELKKKRGSSSYDPFLKDYCIAAEKIDKPRSQYGYFADTSAWVVSEYYGSTIDRIEETVKELPSERVVVKQVFYLLNPWPRGFDYGKVYRCEDVNPQINYQKKLHPKK